MSKWRFGCGQKIQVFYNDRMRTVVCGSSSPFDRPWQCPICYETYKNVNYRLDAAEHGERLEEDES